ncbi:MAG: 2-oxoglutarate and iron-dependent oxygenase domain-containing protein [Pseudomonadota bacterium]|nr:2-oxoglutarate and iron-dependent oxygenase domain-containing protein [Pseudomonadota bacterium]
MSGTIPVVDLTAYTGTDKAARAEFVEALGAGLERFGFVAVSGHGIDAATLEEAYAVARRVFALSTDTKRRYETPEDGRQRGYTSFGVEHAKDTQVPDLKEFWHVGRTLPADHPGRLSGDVPANRHPAEVPEFGPLFDSLFARMEGFANALLEGVAEYLGQPTSYFRQMVTDGNSVLRLINYPELGGGVPGGALRAAAHEDINLLTVLPVSTKPGLELLTREGVWMPVHVPPDVMVCDTGDMMQLLTGGRLPATTHRVVNPGGRDGGRLSMPFFLHPHPDWMLTPLRGDAPAVRTREFLHERLKAIGVA